MFIYMFILVCFMPSTKLSWTLTQFVTSRGEGNVTVVAEINYFKQIVNTGCKHLYDFKVKVHNNTKVVHSYDDKWLGGMLYLVWLWNELLLLSLKQFSISLPLPPEGWDISCYTYILHFLSQTLPMCRLCSQEESLFSLVTVYFKAGQSAVESVKFSVNRMTVHIKIICIMYLNAVAICAVPGTETCV